MAVKRLKLVLGLLVLILLVYSSFAAVKTFRVKETDFVKITADTTDLDNDTVKVYYSLPLDNEGEWQTDYGDAGEYFINLTASDGVTQKVEAVKLVVEKKNQPPFIAEKKIIVKETQAVDLKLAVSDPENDALDYQFFEPFSKDGIWETTYDDAGNYLAEFTISDGEYTIEGRVEIEVVNTNQPPTITKTVPEEKMVTVSEDDTLTFSADAADENGDILTYEWKIDGQIISTEQESEYYFNYSSSGEHWLNLTVSDGEKKTEQNWKIKVENVNRRPVLEFLPITLYEGERVILEHPPEDLDGDELEYSFESPLDKEGTWETTYDDAGQYSLKVTASDGEFAEEELVEITVLDVDRAPFLEVPERLDLYEGGSLSLEIKTLDPDGDETKVEVNNLPLGAEFDEDIVSWNLDYDIVKRSGSFVSEILNSLRLEKYWVNDKRFPVTVKSCGKELCSNKEVLLVVHNVNRGPVFENVSNVTVTETETVKLSVQANDPDGDVIKYYFSQPVGRRDGSWKTGYDDEGNYTVWVTATDGYLENIIPVEVTVLKNNRLPTLKINNDKFTVNEGQQFMFRVQASDPDQDNLTVKLNYLPKGASFSNGIFLWETSYDIVQNKSRSRWNDLVSNIGYLNKKFNSDQETVWLSFSVSDGEYEVVHPIKIVVKDVNQKPELLDYLPAQEIRVKVNQPLVFNAVAKDVDNDLLRYSWDFGIKDKVKGSNTIERTFVTPGDKTVRVTVSDGREEIAKKWKVTVEDVPYREPVREAVSLDPVTYRVYSVDI